MSNRHFALKAVAAAFCFVGALSVVDMALELARGYVSLNLGVLALFVGVGLFRHSHPWRVAAVVCACLTVVASLALGVALLVGGQPIVYTGWEKAGTLPFSAGVAFAVLGFAIGLWQLWVLTRPQVKQLFQPANVA